MPRRKTEGKKLWGKFYWSDWLADEQLAQCSLAAQGLWMRMLCIAAKSDPVGYVAVNGAPLKADGIARIVGGDIEEVERLLAELLDWGVYSVDRRGCIYNRRMIKEDKREIIARSNGARGGNPSLLKDSSSASSEKDNPTQDNQSDNGTDNQTDKGGDKTQRLEARVQNPPNPPYSETDPPASSEPGEGSDDRKAKARSIIAAFDDSIAEVWGAEQRRPHPRPMDIQTALDWVDAGADVEVCRRVFLEVGHRFAESGQPPPGSLKARDRDVRQALAAIAGPDQAEPSRDLLLSSGERAFGYAVRHLPSEQAAALKATANDPAMTDLDRARKAKQMLAEAGMRT